MSTTIKEATDLLSVSRQTIYNYINKFTDDERKTFIFMKGKIQTLTDEGLEHIKNQLTTTFNADTELLKEKDVYISELEEKLVQRDYELQNLYKEQSELLSEISNRHSEQMATITQLLSNQQALTLQAQNNNKPTLLARIFGKEKGGHK